MGNWIKMHKKVTVMIAIFLFGAIIMPFIINCAYIAGWKRTEPNTAFSASDMLALYGAILTFISTTTLGVVAVYQGMMSQKLSTSMQQLERARFVSILSVTRLIKL